jgi:hypothetical protein
LIRFQLILLALLFSLLGVAQNAVLKLRVNPSDSYSVRINDGKIHKTNQFVLFAGENKISIWAPGYLVVDTIIDLKVDEQRTFVIHLEQSPEYITWYNEKRIINEKRFKLQIPATAITVGAALYSTVNQVQYLDAKKRLENAVQAYDLAYTPGVFPKIKDEYNLAQSNYRKQRTELIVGYSLTAASTAFMIYQLRKAAKLKVPSYEDPHKLQFEGVGFVPGDGRYPASWQGTLSLKF